MQGGDRDWGLEKIKTKSILDRIYRIDRIMHVLPDPYMIYFPLRSSASSAVNPAAFMGTAPISPDP